MPWSDNYSFGDLDLYLDNDDSDDARGLIEDATPGSFENVLRPFSYNGVNAEFVQPLGTRGRTDHWRYYVQVKSKTTLITLIETLELYKTSRRSYAFTSRGQSFQMAYLADFKPGRLTGLVSPGGFIIGQEFDLVFRIVAQV